jgi:hypothetical protein
MRLIKFSIDKEAFAIREANIVGIPNLRIFARICPTGAAQSARTGVRAMMPISNIGEDDRRRRRRGLE